SNSARVYSNTIVGNTDHGITIGTTDAASPSASVHNNIIQDNDPRLPQENIKAITSPRSDQGYDGDFNVVSPGTYDPTTLQGDHDLNTAGTFVSRSGGDFHVLQGSEVVDAGGALIVDDALIRLLRSRTVIAGGSGDTGVLDIGFHYPTH